MGLTLHYELRLAANTSDDSVDAILSAMHAFARTLPFSEVTELSGPAAPGGWLDFWTGLIRTPHRDDTPQLFGDAGTSRGFLVNPGDGCESAVFGFMRRADSCGALAEWYWYSFCKTQYASVISEDHFATCHTALVALLDHAATLGVAVVVSDDSRYWNTRDLPHLLAQVHSMNRIVAAVAGRLSDVVGPEHEVKAPIFEHPDFEHLEMGE